MKRLPLWTVWLLAMLVPVVSAEGLETLVVSGRTEGASTVPGSHSLNMDQQQPGLRIDSGELLQGLPGVQADSRSNYAQDTRVTLRGFGARSAFGVRGIDLSLDGIPLSTPDGQGQLSSLPVDQIARVEVLRGPLASLYGNGAGGVIRFESFAPRENRVGARLLAGEGDRQRHALTGAWRQGRWSARAWGSQFETDGVRPHSRAERRHAGGQVHYETGGGVEVIARLNTSHDPLLQDPSGLSPERWRENPRATHPRTEQFNTRKKIRHRQGSLSLRQNRGDRRWQASFWQGQREVDQWLPFAGSGITSSGAVIDLTRDFAGMRTSYTLDASLLDAPLETTLGMSLERMRDRRRGYVNDEGETGELRRHETGTVDSHDLYAIARWQPAERWELTGGLRGSDLSFAVDDYFIVPEEEQSPGNPDDSGGRDDRFVSGALGASYRLDEHWRLHASAGQGHETPTLTEMAYRNEGSGLNTDLSPAENRQWELGAEWGAAPRLAVALFGVNSDDELVVDRSEGGRTTYRNAAETERQGLELSGELPLAPGWRARYSASYLEAEYTAGPWAGNRLPGVADTNLYGQLRWQPWRDERLGLALVGRYRSEVATADDNTTWAPSATTWDLSLDTEQQWGDWDVSGWLKLENVADKTYVGSVIVNQGSGRSFEPAPGRQFSAGLNLAYQW